MPPSAIKRRKLRPIAAAAVNYKGNVARHQIHAAVTLRVPTAPRHTCAVAPCASLSGRRPPCPCCFCSPPSPLPRAGARARVKLPRVPPPRPQTDRRLRGRPDPLLEPHVITPYDVRFPVAGPWLVQMGEDAFALVGLSVALALVVTAGLFGAAAAAARARIRCCRRRLAGQMRARRACLLFASIKWQYLHGHVIRSM